MIAIGGLIGLISVFVVWVNGNGLTITGIGIIYDYNNTLLALIGYRDLYILFIPLIVLSFSASGLVNGSMLAVRKTNRGGAGIAIYGAIMLLATVVFIMYSRPITTECMFYMSDYISIGVYMAVAGGILMMVFGALKVALRRTSKKAEGK